MAPGFSLEGRQLVAVALISGRPSDRRSSKRLSCGRKSGIGSDKSMDYSSAYSHNTSLKPVSECPYKRDCFVPPASHVSWATTTVRSIGIAGNVLNDTHYNPGMVALWVIAGAWVLKTPGYMSFRR